VPQLSVKASGYPTRGSREQFLPLCVLRGCVTRSILMRKMPCRSILSFWYFGH